MMEGNYYPVEVENHGKKPVPEKRKKLSQSQISLIAIIVLAVILLTSATFFIINKISNPGLLKILVEPSLDFDSVYSYGEGLLRVCKDKKYGIIDKKGKIVWEFSNRDIPDTPLLFMTGFQYFSDGRFLLTNWSGHTKSPADATHLLLINRQKEILCRIGAIDGIQTMSTVYSLEKPKDGIKIYH